MNKCNTECLMGPWRKEVMKDIIGIVGKIEIQDVYNSIVSVRNSLSFKIILCLYRRRSLFLRDIHTEVLRGEVLQITN